MKLDSWATDVGVVLDKQLSVNSQTTAVSQLCVYQLH